MGSDESDEKYKKAAHPVSLSRILDCKNIRLPARNTKNSFDAGGYREETVLGNAKPRGNGSTSPPGLRQDIGTTRGGISRICPSVGVTWFEASAFCVWLDEQLHGSGFRFQTRQSGQLMALNLNPATLQVRCHRSRMGKKRQVGMRQAAKTIMALGGYI